VSVLHVYIFIVTSYKIINEFSFHNVIIIFPLLVIFLIASSPDTITIKISVPKIINKTHMVNETTPD
jgi:hypothetical protein